MRKHDKRGKHKKHSKPVQTDKDRRPNAVSGHELLNGQSEAKTVGGSAESVVVVTTSDRVVAVASDIPEVKNPEVAVVTTPSEIEPTVNDESSGTPQQGNDVETNMSDASETPANSSLPEAQKRQDLPTQPREPRPVPSVLRPGISRMYVVQITPELAPVAKVGGLGDVVFGLSRELEWRGNTVETILPKYDCLRYDQIWGLSPCFNDLWVPWYNGHVHCTVYSGSVHDRRCYFIEPHSKDNFFNRGTFYGHHDDIFRFAFFSRAAMEFMYKSGKNPEIIHCHDWQTGLVPVFLYEIYQRLGMSHSRVCYTVHNFRHQGVTGEQILGATGLNDRGRFNHPDRLRDPRHASAINLMKGGIVYSNFVTTVSPRHAWEAKTDQGFGLEPTLHTHHVKYGGVLNGVDYGVWNPEIDSHLAKRYTVQTLDDKYENKRALRQRFWLADNAKPIIAFIGRLDEQKGLELIRHAAYYAVRNNAQFVLLGSAPDHRVGNQFWQLKRDLNDSPDCHIELGFNEELSHLIYAGADMMLVPSRYEPCGLTQLIALKYGTVPIVRAVGGLADSVFDKDYDHRPLEERNGYVFEHYDTRAIDHTLGRAIACYYNYPEHFRHLIQNGMRADYSWNFPGQHYLNIYDHIREK
jgi:starch synthase